MTPVNAYRGTPAQPRGPQPTPGAGPTAQAGEAAGAEAPAAPNRTPAHAPVSEMPEQVSREATSVGAQAAKTMPVTWDANAGAEGSAGRDGPMPARTLSRLEQEAIKAGEEAWKKADETICKTVVGGLVAWGTKSKTAGGIAAWAVCREPGPKDAGGEHGSPGAPPAGGMAGRAGWSTPPEGGAGGASGAGR
ncbi:MAG TPA: hypothetical protein VFS43_35765 [Polyangiaceae bacterium]|nr:hypothetical protein [Polyangiaceae bacterium]